MSMKIKYSKASEAADALGLSTSYLRREAMRGNLPEGSVIATPGGHHMYNIRALQAWMLNNFKKQSKITRMETASA